jgi:ribokinase
MMTGAARPLVAIVGSANLDVVVEVARHPRPGETVIGGDLARMPGGKGANQAVACARLGAATRFIGAVGDDEAGQHLLSAMAADAVDTSSVRIDATRPSGHALIVVAAGGENTIVVSPGANAGFDREALPSDRVAAADAVLMQLEIPVDAVAAAVDAAQGLVVLNPAPAADLPAAVLARTDVLVPNRSELAILSGQQAEPTTTDEVVDLARSLEGPQRVVVTLGADGAVAIEGDEVLVVPARAVRAVDATAAGDSFCAALTVALLEGADLAAAVRFAGIAASVTVTRRGAQPSLPTRDDVDRAHGPPTETPT